LNLDVELQTRLTAIESRIQAACDRAHRVRKDVTLIAVSKTATADVAKVVSRLGVKDFGESRPQEIWKKSAAIPQMHWHLIGHLQRNKLDKTIPMVSLIHSVDSERVLSALSDFGMGRGLPVPILLEINCSREESKGGISPDDAAKMGDMATSLPGVRFEGLMTMAAYGNDPEESRPTFVELRQIRDQLRTATGLKLPHLSMGMSNDFEVAIEEGSTYVRVGSTLFGGLSAEAE